MSPDGTVVEFKLECLEGHRVQISPDHGAEENIPDELPHNTNNRSRPDARREGEIDRYAAQVMAFLDWLCDLPGMPRPLDMFRWYEKELKKN